MPSSGRPQAYQTQISHKAWATSSLPTQEKLHTRSTQREGQGGISPCTPSSHHHQLVRTRSRASGLPLRVGGTLRSHLVPRQPRSCVHIQQAVSVAETRSPKHPPSLAASCRASYVSACGGEAVGWGPNFGLRGQLPHAAARAKLNGDARQDPAAPQSPGSLPWRLGALRAAITR